MASLSRSHSTRVVFASPDSWRRLAPGTAGSVDTSHVSRRSVPSGETSQAIQRASGECSTRVTGPSTGSWTGRSSPRPSSVSATCTAFG
nr:hypothetical protein [Corynebacterium xerosis]